MRSLLLARYKPQIKWLIKVNPIFAGLLLPLGFSPFHLPGLSILSLAWLFSLLTKKTTLKIAWTNGFLFGLGVFTLGVSWIYISIHDYGHLNAVLSLCITTLFIVYLALFPALVCSMYKLLENHLSSALFSCLSFSAIWVLVDYLRANLFGGFPWLLLGFSQIDTPLNTWLPILGVYGCSFFVCLAATFLAKTFERSNPYYYYWLTAFVALLIIPSFFSCQWATAKGKALKAGVVQANIAMKNKWNEQTFYQLINHYQQAIERLIEHNDLVVMPESAIPIPIHYVNEFIEFISNKATEKNRALLLGTLQSTSPFSDDFFNTMIALGQAEGQYRKRQLVPFGEFIPKSLQFLLTWFEIPTANVHPGKTNQPLIKVLHHPIASLICYELAYPERLRNQLPKAEWIVSISDDGWFGHSLALYQHVQMARVLSRLTARQQIVANNDGLSTFIGYNGEILASLPPFEAGILQYRIQPAQGSTWWVSWGDKPILAACLVILLLAFIRGNRYFTRRLD